MNINHINKSYLGRDAMWTGRNLRTFRTNRQPTSFCRNMHPVGSFETAVVYQILRRQFQDYYFVSLRLKT